MAGASGQDNRTILRYLSTGELDNTFGQRGTIVGQVASGVRSLLLQSDGKMLVGGRSNYDFNVARYLPSGSLDPTFGHSGEVVTAVGGNAYVAAMALQTDGKIIASGSGGTSGPNAFQPRSIHTGRTSRPILWLRRAHLHPVRHGICGCHGGGNSGGRKDCRGDQSWDGEVLIPSTGGLGDEREVFTSCLCGGDASGPGRVVEVFDMSHTGSRWAIRPRRVMPWARPSADCRPRRSFRSGGSEAPRRYSAGCAAPTCGPEPSTALASAGQPWRECLIARLALRPLRSA